MAKSTNIRSTYYHMHYYIENNIIGSTGVKILIKGDFA